MRGIFNDAYVILSLIFFMKAHAVGTHLNCLDLSRRFRQASTFCFYKVDKSTWAVIKEIFLAKKCVQYWLSA